MVGSDSAGGTQARSQPELGESRESRCRWRFSGTEWNLAADCDRGEPTSRTAAGRRRHSAAHRRRRGVKPKCRLNGQAIGEPRFLRRTPLAFYSRSRVRHKFEAAAFGEESGAVAVTAEAVECSGQDLETRGRLTRGRLTGRCNF